MKASAPLALSLLSVLSLASEAAADRRRAVAGGPGACAIPRGGAPLQLTNDWIVDGDHLVENRTITLNGTLEVRRGTLTLRNVAIEINAQRNSSWTSGAVVAIDIGPAAELVMTGVRIVATSSAPALLQGDRAARVVAENSCFRHMGVVLSGTDAPRFSHNEIALQGNDGLVAITLMNSSAARVEENTIRFAVDPRTGSVPNGAGGIYLFFSHDSTVSRNTVVGPPNGISLWGSWNNQVSENLWKGPTALTAIHVNTPNWWSISTPAGSGEAGISLSWWSNNNVIDRNTLMGAQSAVMFILQSANNTISRNVIAGAGYGVTLRWASHILIDGNELTDVFSDAIHSYRSHDVTITNNHIRSSGSGVSFYASDRNTVRSNTIVDCDRGLFLHTSLRNTVDGNTVSGAVQGLFVAASSRNDLTRNNLVDTDQPAWDDRSDNSWRGNYWSGGPHAIPPGAVADQAPAGALVPSGPAPVEPLVPIVFKEPLNSVITIREAQVWQETRTLSGSIQIESGGSLTLRGAMLTYQLTEPTASIWIHVKPGGVLIIEDSKITGPEWDHTLSIKVYKGATFSMKRSELRNAGSWVGTFAAAIANEADDIVVEDSTFVDTYCALSGEGGPANTRFVNNTIHNSVKAIELIGPHPGANMTGNRFSGVAMWGIGVWPYAGFAPSRVTDNAFSDSWGPAVKNYFNAGSFEIARNTFTNVKGPSVLIMETNAQTESRQVHVISTSASAAPPGQPLEVVVNLANVLVGRQPPPDRRIFLVTLSINGKPVQTRRIALPLGIFERVKLQGVAGEPGPYEISINTEP